MEKLRNAAEEAAKGSAFIMSGNFISAAILALNSMVLARLLGPDKYGLYSLSISLAPLLIGLSDIGITSFLTRTMALMRNDERAGEHASFALRIAILMSILLSATGIMISGLYSLYILNRPELSIYVRTAVLSVPFAITANSAASILLGLGMANKSSKIPVAQSISKFLTSTSLVMLGFSVLGAVLGHLTGYIAAGIFGFILIRKYIRRRISGSLSSLLGYGLPLYFSSIIAILTNQYIIMLLSSFSNFEIGNYYTALSLSSVLGIVASSIGSVMLPTFSSMLDEVERMLKLSVRYSSLLMVPLAVSVIIFSPDITRIFFGRRYTLTPLYLSLLSANYLLVGVGSISIGPFFSSLGKTGMNLLLTASNALFLLIFSLFLIRFGVPGLIASQIASSFSSLLLGLLILKKFNASIELKESAKIYTTAFLPAIPILLAGSFVETPVRILLLPIYLLLYISIAPFISLRQRDLEFLSIFSRMRFIGRAADLILSYEKRIAELRSRGIKGNSG
ncbi:MAG: oligosaccharide flippase family protein [Candidatus Methanodesulfokora sp.]|jgi:O-antigen/teichoic acid export membrane protein